MSARVDAVAGSVGGIGIGAVRVTGAVVHLDTSGIRAGARGRGIVDLDALVDVLQAHSVQPCLLAIYTLPKLSALASTSTSTWAHVLQLCSAHCIAVGAIVTAVNHRVQ